VSSRVPIGWAAGPVVVDPAAGTVLAETEALPSGLCHVQVHATCNPPGFEVVFEWRRAGTTHKQKILPVTLALLTWQPISALVVDKGDALRVIARGDIQGEVEVSIFYGDAPTLHG